MIDDGPSDIFVAAFFLVPSNRDSGILKHANPLAIPSIQIHRSASNGQPSASLQDTTYSALMRIGNFLMSQLRIEYQEKGEKIRDHEAHIAVPRLKEQFVAYAKGVWPFNWTFTAKSDIVTYWRSFLEHDNADILAYFATKLFAVAVNSMADERTASTMTWLNSAIQSSQKSSTLINQVQVRQWVLMERASKQEQQTTSRKPILKFCDLCGTVDMDGSHLDIVLQETDTTASQDDSDTEAGWLDGDNTAVERDWDYLACGGDSLAAATEANLDIPVKSS